MVQLCFCCRKFKGFAVILLKFMYWFTVVCWLHVIDRVLVQVNI